MEPDFSTLLKKNNVRSWDRWYPVSITVLRDSLLLDWNVSNGRPSVNNICYNLQYLEYMCLQLRELKLSSVITIMLWKNIVTTSVSIIEAILENRLLSAGLLKETGKNRHLSQMIHLIRKHPEAISLSPDDLDEIDELRGLRNKVHLQNSEGGMDHDYFNFDEGSAMEARRLLYKVLASPEISRNATCFRFLIRD